MFEWYIKERILIFLLHVTNFRFLVLLDINKIIGSSNFLFLLNDYFWEPFFYFQGWNVVIMVHHMALCHSCVVKEYFYLLQSCLSRFHSRWSQNLKSISSTLLVVHFVVCRYVAMMSILFGILMDLLVN